MRDRVVQAALKPVLEPVRETDFLPCPHFFLRITGLPGHKRRDDPPPDRRLNPGLAWSMNNNGLTLGAVLVRLDRRNGG
ncbi:MULTISPECIES: hypothetical protein [unclassified Streptomyces]|uniref:hypothetical protein n=1 Tax=unclassified Streptomyces TaxID=2593676 RepID=UPI00342D514C